MPASSHQQRILTAALTLGLVVLALWQGGVFVLLAVLLVSGLGLWEFTALFRPGPAHAGLRRLGACLGVGLPLLVRFGPPQALLWGLTAAFWILALRFLLRYGRDQKNAEFYDEMIVMAGVAYVPLTLQFFLTLRIREIILVLIATIVSDTAAFYAGSLWGRKKIWPQISPKKSWVGSIGGLLGCTAAVTAYGLFFGSAPLAAWLGLGVLLNVASQLGDFFESAVKRRLAVKDSGTLLPGHGGLLDRIDSLLLALPCYVLCRQALFFFG